MPQSLAKILVHTVFSTKDRRPFLRDKMVREELHRYVGGILARLDCQPVIVGGVEDHVHLLCALSRTLLPSSLFSSGLTPRERNSWMISRCASIAAAAPMLCPMAPLIE